MEKQYISNMYIECVGELKSRKIMNRVWLHVVIEVHGCGEVKHTLKFRLALTPEAFNLS